MLLLHILLLPLLIGSALEPHVPVHEPDPVRVGVVGLTHGHVGWILGREDHGDIEIVGIAEPDRALASAYAERFGFSMDLVFESVEELIEATRPEAITAFNPIAMHLPTVEVAARKGVHVMVEKPLHFSLRAAQRMKEVADSAGIHLLTNYETTWYPTTTRMDKLVEAGQLGTVRKIVAHDGHSGPKEIGVGEEFLEWLTDPEMNGGGAIVDFGCYGANLMTWLLGGKRPLSVTAVTQTLKPDIYREVDDEATIVLEYEAAQGIIQASWNWPYSRKDLEVYGTDGYAIADNASDLRVKTASEGAEEMLQQLTGERPLTARDPFAYLAGVVRGDIQPGGSLSSLEVNMVVVEILDAAIRSAAEGRTIHLNAEPVEGP